MHAVLISAEAANGSGAFVHCFYCGEAAGAAGEGERASSYARAAERLIRSFAFYPPCPSFVLTESKVLGSRRGAFDFSIPLLTPWGLRWVHEEVDGETRFNKPRQGESLGAQQDKDRRKDSAAWEQQLMLVRLQFADMGTRGLWGAALQQATGLAREQQCQHRFIICTPSYKLLGLRTKIEAL